MKVKYANRERVNGWNGQHLHKRNGQYTYTHSFLLTSHWHQPTIGIGGIARDGKLLVSQNDTYHECQEYLKCML
jgi:hypothetical protein